MMNFEFQVIGFDFYSNGANVELASFLNTKDAEAILRKYQRRYPDKGFALKQGSTVIVL